MATQLETRRFTVREYQRLLDAAVLGEDEHVELLDGVIAPMSPTSPRHAAHVARLGELLRALVGARAHVREEKAVVLEPATQPEPDLAVVRPRPDFYAGGHPGAADILLLVEVAETSLERARGVKLALYVRAGIPAVWVLDLPGDRLWVASGPRDTGYADVIELTRPEDATPLTVPGLLDLSLSVRDILGPRPA
jgi:hypothetical protein